MKSKWFLIILILFVCSISQQIYANTKFNLIFQNLTLEHGLPSLEVPTIFQQSNGYIWIGTSRGASRFDGHQFQKFYYHPGNPNHISNNFVIDITEDNSNNIWIATEDGLNKLAPDGDMEVFKKQDGLPSSWILKLLFDSSDRLWISTGDGTVIHEPASNQFHQIELNIDDSVTDFIELPDKRIIAAISGKLLLLDPKEKTSQDIYSEQLSKYMRSNDLITVLSLLNDNELMVGTEKSGLVVINLNDNSARVITTQEGLSSNTVTALLAVDKQRILVGHYENGLTYLDLQSGYSEAIIKREFDDLSLLSNTIRKLFLDDNENLWVTTDYGISKTRLKNHFKYYYAYPNKVGLSGKDVYKSMPLNEQDVLVLSNKGLDKVNLITNEITRNLLGKEPSEIERDADIWSFDILGDEVWMAASSGVKVLNLITGDLKHYSNGDGNKYNLPMTEIYTVLGTPEQSAWITGYYNIGIALFDKEKGISRQYMHEWSDIYTNEGNYTQSKLICRDGNIWMATTDGLFKVNPETGDYEHIRLGEGREYIRASHVQQDKHGDIWVASEGAGLVKLTYNSVTNTYLKKFYTKEHGLTENELFSITIDEDIIWVFTTHDLSVFNTKTEQAISFEGLFQIPNLNFNVASSYLWNDKLVVSSNQGLFFIDHKQLSQSTYEPSIVISEIKTPELQLIHYGNNGPREIADGDIEFTVASLDYTSLENTKFLYRLMNFDEEWSATERTKINYGHLPPGDYIFEVIGTNADGVWTTRPATYEFTVIRPARDYVIGALIILLATFFLLYLMQRKQQISDLHSQIRIDSLTRLPNRLGFNEQLRSSMKIENSIFALAVLDFDGFKDINDIYGHSVGDKFLQEVGHRLRDSIKGRDYIARLSGDEFVLILYHFINEENLFNIVNRIREVLSQEYELDDTLLKSSVSIGIAIYPKDGISRQELFSHADTAMYQAKKLGKNQIYFFNDQLRQQLERKIAIKANLEKALERHEFELYYQPKVNPTSMTIVGCEALIRWNHPEQGLVPPDQFIGEAEKNGFIAELGAWIVKQACQDYATITSTINTMDSISVNISPKQLMKQDFIQILDDALETTGMSPKHLELEITENSLMDESTNTLDLLDELKRRGIRIALDDFGTGYSSLSYLTKYPIDTLKIDRSIIISANQDSPSLKVLRNVFMLAHSLEMQVVTEGVETLEQLKLLEGYREDLIQGYLFCKPLPMNDLINFYQEFSEKHSPRNDL